MNESIDKPRNFAGVTLEEATSRARGLVPTLRKRATQCEGARVLLTETANDLHAAGLFRYHQPARVGGMELDFVAIVDLCAEIARGCASTAWNVGNLGNHHFILALYPERAQEEVWSRSPDHLVASALAFPSGTGRKVDGGFVVSGEWSFSSGIDASEWNMCAVTIKDSPDGRTIDHRICLLPRSDYEVTDNWFAAGLKGTGSKAVRCNEVFVPTHRALCMYDIRGGDHPGSRINPGALYRVPLFALAAHCLAGAALGNAQAILDLFIEANVGRRTHYTGANIADFQAVQVKVAQASAQLDAARHLLRADAMDAMSIARAGGVPDLGTKLKYRKNAAFAVDLCTQAVTTLFSMAGANGLYEDSPMQRIFRDAYAIRSHVNFAFDAAGSWFGTHVLGGSVNNPML